MESVKKVYDTQNEIPAVKQEVPSEPSPHKPVRHPVAQLHKIFGNQTITRMAKTLPFKSSIWPLAIKNKTRLAPSPEVESPVPYIQGKMKLGSSGDIYEQEADKVAEQVVRFTNSPDYKSLPDANLSPHYTSPILGQAQQQVQKISCANPEKTTRPSIIRCKGIAGKQEETVSASTERQISQSKGKGSPLPVSVRSAMESQTGYNFSAVRVKKDEEAAQLNQNLNARAFTLGSDIWLGKNESPSDMKLMAHELTHVAQQGSAGSLMAKSNTVQRQIRRVNPAPPSLIQREEGYSLDPSRPTAAGDAADGKQAAQQIIDKTNEEMQEKLGISSKPGYISPAVMSMLNKNGSVQIDLWKRYLAMIEYIKKTAPPPLIRSALDAEMIQQNTDAPEEEEEEPREATGEDALKALQAALKDTLIEKALKNLEANAKNQLSKFGPLEWAGVIGTGLILVGSTVIANYNKPQQLEALDGKDLTVPAADWLKIKFGVNTKGKKLDFRLGVDFDILSAELLTGESVNLTQQNEILNAVTGTEPEIKKQQGWKFGINFNVGKVLPKSWGFD